MQTQGQMSAQQAQLLQSITDTMNHLAASGSSTDMAAAPGTAHKPINYRSGILESKAVMNLKSLESDKSTFRTWNDKLINAMSQAIEHSRALMSTNEYQ